MALFFAGAGSAVSGDVCGHGLYQEAVRRAGLPPSPAASANRGQNSTADFYCRDYHAQQDVGVAEHSSARSSSLAECLTTASSASTSQHVVAVSAVQARKQAVGKFLRRLWASRGRGAQQLFPTTASIALAGDAASLVQLRTVPTTGGGRKAVAPPAVATPPAQTGRPKPSKSWQRQGRSPRILHRIGSQAAPPTQAASGSKGPAGHSSGEGSRASGVGHGRQAPGGAYFTHQSAEGCAAGASADVGAASAGGRQVAVQEAACSGFPTANGAGSATQDTCGQGAVRNQLGTILTAVGTDFGGPDEGKSYGHSSFWGSRRGLALAIGCGFHRVSEADSGESSSAVGIPVGGADGGYARGCCITDGTSRAVLSGCGRTMPAATAGSQVGQRNCSGQPPPVGTVSTGAGVVTDTPPQETLGSTGGQRFRRSGGRCGLRQGGRDSAPSIGPWCRLRQTHGPSGIELRWRPDVLTYSNFVSPWFAQVLGLWAGFVAAVQDLLPGDLVLSEADPRLDDSILRPTRSWLQGESETGACSQADWYIGHDPTSWFDGTTAGGGVIVGCGAFRQMDSWPVVEPAVSMTPFPGSCTIRSRLAGHAHVQRAKGPPSCSRSMYKDGGRRSVKFSDTVAFWFPVAGQLHIPAACAPAINDEASGHTGHRCSARCIGPVIPDVPASVTSAVQGGSRRSLQQRHQVGPPVPAVQGGSCRSLQPRFLPQDSPADWPCLKPLSRPPGRCSNHSWATSAADRIRVWGSASSFHHAATDSEALLCAAPVEDEPSARTFLAPGSGSPPKFLHVPRRNRPKSKAQATSMRFGASTHSPLGVGRQTPVPGHSMPAAMSGVSSHPIVGSQIDDRSRHPYTSFDAVVTSRTLQAEAGWPEWKYVTVAITTSSLPGNALGRTMRHRVRGFPSPQVAIMIARRFDPRRTVVFDARDVEGPLAVYDVRVGATMATTLLAPDAPPAFVPILNALRAGLLLCRVNGVVSGLDAPLDATADVVHFSHTSASVHNAGPAERPPTPPVPEGASSSSADTLPMPPQPLPRWNRARAASSTSASARAANTAAVKWDRALASDDDVAVCTIFDPVRQFELSESSACRSSARLLNHAISKATHLAPNPDGRVINHHLPGLPRPQVCVHSVVHANYVVIPISLGGGQYCTLAIERSASVYELFLLLETLCSVPRAHRQLLTRGWLTLAINGVETEDVFFLTADSASLLRSPEADPGLVPDVLRLSGAHPSTVDGCLTLHRPAAPPLHFYVNPYATPSDIHVLLQAGGLLDTHGIALPLDLSPVQYSNGAHFLALDPLHLGASQAWLVFDLRRVTHPPFVTLWTAPQLSRTSLPAFADYLAGEFPSLDPIIAVYSGASLCDLVVTGSQAQATLVTVVGAPRDSLRTGRPQEPAVCWSCFP